MTYNRFIVTPAFIDARRRKIQNDITMKGVFPEAITKKSVLDVNKYGGRQTVRKRSEQEKRSRASVSQGT